MARHLILLAALLIACFIFLLPGQQVSQHAPYIRGRNSTVLILANNQAGLSNVHTATAASLLENFPDTEVHYASFRGMGEKLQRVSLFARVKSSSVREIIFHELEGQSYGDGMEEAGKTGERMVHAPASTGISDLTNDLQIYLSPWTVESHLELYSELGGLIDQVDPAVVVLDTLFKPAIDITRDRNRQHAFITPNTAVDNFLGEQPHGSMFWRYPAMGSGFAYPVSWRNIPENIYLNLRFIYAVVKTPALAEKQRLLSQRGLKNPINFFNLYRSDVPWFSMTTEGATIPVQYIPPNVTCAGPIVLSSAPAEEQDPELAAWLKRNPTVLVNLGSHVNYNEERATAMVGAFADVLNNTNIQILWKFNKLGTYSDSVFLPLRQYMAEDRVRLEDWLSVDPNSILETGDIVASIHHGGSNCYHEAIAAGVSQLILPLWLDLYNFAALVEGLGIGVWGCKASSPRWTAECLRNALLQVADGGDKSKAMQKAAKRLSEKVNSRGRGREIVAEKIAKMACVGCQGVWEEDDSCKRVSQGRLGQSGWFNI